MSDQKLKITIEAARRNAKLTQKQASELSGIGRDRLIKAESSSEESTLTVLEVIKLCEVYGLDISNIKF